MGKITRKNEDDIKREDKDKRTMMVNDNLGENTKKGVYFGVSILSYA